MSRVEILKKSRNSISVKFLEFTRIISKKKNRVAVFFEGEDEKYYSVRINTIRPDITWSGINSQGKSNVLSLRDKIRNHSTYKEAPCIFFVDSDFDENTAISKYSDTYITPCYSIENLYMSDKVFENILNAEFGLSDTTEDHQCYENALNTYKKTKKSYLISIREFNYLIKEIRRLENENKLKTKLNINNLSIEKLITIRLGKASKIYNENNPKEIFPELPDNKKISLQASQEYFNDLSEELWFRGKQHIDFLRIFLSHLKTDRSSKKARIVFKDKGKVRLNLTKANTISELSQYAETPYCLRKFLEKQLFI